MKHVVSSALLLGLSSLSLAAQAAPIALDLPAQPLAASLEQLPVSYTHLSKQRTRGTMMSVANGLPVSIRQAVTA